MAGHIDHDRVTCVNMRFEIGQREAAGGVVVGALRVAFHDRVAAFFIEQLAAVSTVVGVNVVTDHVRAGQFVWRRGPVIEGGGPVGVAVSRLAGLHVVADGGAPGVLGPASGDVGGTG